MKKYNKQIILLVLALSASFAWYNPQTAWGPFVSPNYSGDININGTITVNALVGNGCRPPQ